MRARKPFASSASTSTFRATARKPSRHVQPSNKSRHAQPKSATTVASPSVLSRWLPPRRVILPALPKPRKVANGVPLPIARALSRSRHVI